MQVGNNGYITLKYVYTLAVAPLKQELTRSGRSILHPVDKASTSSPRDAILYLPPGPLSLPTKRKVAWNQHREEYTGSGGDNKLPSLQHILASKTLSTVITLNYRLGSSNSTPSRANNGDAERGVQGFMFPTPIHDTLAGFDWIFRHVKPRRLCVFGENIGGSLAMMLGLTEPQSVHAIVAEEPVCDWTGLDGYCLSPPEINGDEGTGTAATASSDDEQVTKKRVGRRKSKKEPTTAQPDLMPLLEARRRFFRKPDNYFDSFASPALFLRSAGKDCPSDFPAYLVGPDYPVPVLERSIPEELNMEEEFVVPERPIRRRKAISRWPPYGLDYQMSGERRIVSGAGASRTVKIELPWVRLFVHSNKPDPEQKNDPSGASEDSEITRGVEKLDLDASPSGETDSTPAPEGRNGGRRSRKRPTEAGLAEESVLAAQGVEMVSLLHAACFFGREKGFGEERAKLIRMPIPGEQDISPSEHDLRLNDRNGEAFSGTAESTATSEDSVAKQAGEWFREILGGKME